MGLITTMIETPKGCNYKLTYEPGNQTFTLRKILPAGLVFPFDFGFIKNTKGEDGDPLDIIIISEVIGFPGCVVDCRIIGAITADQTERDGKKTRNDRFLGIPDVSQLFADIDELSALPGHFLTQLESFFVNYNAQAGKRFEIINRLSSAQALELIAGQTT